MLYEYGSVGRLFETASIQVEQLSAIQRIRNL